MLENLKLLCVEDDEFTLEQMMAYLKRRGAKVFGAKDGLEGIKQYEIHKPDIIVADLLMPGMDGMEMLRRLKDEHPGIHAIVVTSVNDLDTVLETMDMGVDNYILKPFDFDVLVMKLNKIADEIYWTRGGRSGVFDVMENRRESEDVIKKNFIKLVKGYMGKGPKEITVHLTGDTVKITVLGMLTVMEENLLKDMKNYQMVRQLRYSAYEAISKIFAPKLSEHLKEPMTPEKIEVDLKKQMDQITFKLSR